MHGNQNSVMIQSNYIIHYTSAVFFIYLSVCVAHEPRLSTESKLIGICLVKGPFLTFTINIKCWRHHVTPCWVPLGGTRWMGRPLQGEEDKLFLPSPTLYICPKFLFTLYRNTYNFHQKFLPKNFSFQHN